MVVNQTVNNNNDPFSLNQNIQRLLYYKKQPGLLDKLFPNYEVFNKIFTDEKSPLNKIPALSNITSRLSNDPELSKNVYNTLKGLQSISYAFPRFGLKELYVNPETLESNNTELLKNIVRSSIQYFYPRLNQLKLQNPILATVISQLEAQLQNPTIRGKLLSSDKFDTILKEYINLKQKEKYNRTIAYINNIIRRNIVNTQNRINTLSQNIDVKSKLFNAFNNKGELDFYKMLGKDKDIILKLLHSNDKNNRDLAKQYISSLKLEFDNAKKEFNRNFKYRFDNKASIFAKPFSLNLAKIRYLKSIQNNIQDTMNQLRGNQIFLATIQNNLLNKNNPKSFMSRVIKNPYKDYIRNTGLIDYTFLSKGIQATVPGVSNIFNEVVKSKNSEKNK